MTRRRLRDIPVAPPGPWTGSDLLSLRERLGVSQTTMAQLLGSSRTAIIRYEASGAVLIRSGALRRLLDLLDRDASLVERMAP